MPITQSAKKALRQSKRRYEHNKEKKDELKDAIKKFKKAADAGDAAAAQNYLKLAYKKLDKAAKTYLIKKNTASRLKSRLAIYLNRKS
ncbi:MAG: 30S ribosomal protein S20 [Parcubacteria group bacterium RIFCSPLOWO2_01_FULL_48_18]|nr:MAG: 30S ribosomal protein S20 [Parcubacteria group bacterium RIFCSPLOWO2_01_FULL_48_18]